MLKCNYKVREVNKHLIDEMKKNGFGNLTKEEIIYIALYNFKSIDGEAQDAVIHLAGIEDMKDRVFYLEEDFVPFVNKWFEDEL